MGHFLHGGLSPNGHRRHVDVSRSFIQITPPRSFELLCITDTTFSPLNSTGPFVAAGWLACLGTCSGTGAKVFNNCQKAKGNTGRFYYFGGGNDRKRDVTPAAETCHQMKQWTFACPAQGTGLLDKYDCGPTINT